MKYTLRRKYLAIAITAIALFGLLAPGLLALTAGERWGTDGINRNFKKRVWIDSTLNVDGATQLSGATNIDGALTATSTAAITGNLTRKGEVLTNSAVSLTSPTVTFSAASKGLITLNANANLTGIYPTGGALNQVIVIVPGAGSNTMRFDNGTSMVLGANVTLTEGNYQEKLALRCTSADGDDWELYGPTSTAISTTTGAFSGAVTVGSTLDVTGATTLNGAVALGNATADDVTVPGYVASHVLPKTTATYNFGSGSKVWDTGYFTALSSVNIDMTGNLHQSGSVHADLQDTTVTGALKVTAGTTVDSGGLTVTAGDVNAQGGALKTGGTTRIGNTGALAATTGDFAGSIHQSTGHTDVKDTTVTGELIVSSTITGGTGITATTGNILATAGNVNARDGNLQTSDSTRISEAGALTVTTGDFAGNIHQSTGHTDVKDTTVTGALKTTTLEVTGASTQAAINTTGNIHQSGDVHADLQDTTITGTCDVTGALTGTTGAFTGALTGNRLVTTITTDTVLTAAQCRYGVVLLAAAQDDTTITATMPALAAGFDVIFVDTDLTAGADLQIQMGADDTVNGGTAAKQYVHGGGSTAKGIAHFITVDAVDLMLAAPALEAGAVESTDPKWRNDNS